MASCSSCNSATRTEMCFLRANVAALARCGFVQAAVDEAVSPINHQILPLCPCVPRLCVIRFCADHDEDCRYDLLCWGCGREGTAPTARLDEHVDRIRSPLRSGQGHHTPERVGEAPTSGR